MSQYPESQPGRQVYRALDPILGRWFEAATKELLGHLMNHPVFVSKRIAKTQRMAAEGRAKAHEPAIIEAALLKRRRKNLRRRWLAHQGAYHYSYLPNVGQHTVAC